MHGMLMFWNNYKTKLLITEDDNPFIKPVLIWIYEGAEEKQ